MPTERPLRALTVAWAGTVGVAALLGALGLLVGRRPPADAVSWLPATLVAALGVAMLVAALAVDRLLAASPPTTDAAALRAYRARFVGQLGIALVPAALALAVAVLLGPPWVGLVGTLGSLAAALAARPGRARLARISRHWHALGHDVSLLRAIDRSRSAP